MPGSIPPPTLIEQFRQNLWSWEKNGFTVGLSMAAGSMSGMYFLHWRGYIKIGQAGDVVRRRWSIVSAMPIGVIEPLGWIPSLSAGLQEAFIHRIFAESRGRGEWFEDGPQLRAFIDEYCEPWPAIDHRWRS